MAFELPEHHNDIWQLLSDYCDGKLNEETHQALAKRINDDPEIKQLYLVYMSMHGNMSWKYNAAAMFDQDMTFDVQGLPDTPFDIQFEDIQKKPKSIKRSKKPVEPTKNFWQPLIAYFDGHPKRILATAAMITIMIPIIMVMLMNKNPRQYGTQPIAKVVDLRNTVFKTLSKDAPNIIIGGKLPTGTYSLESGFIDAETTEGVSFTISGPSEFQILSPKHVKMISGNIVATVSKTGRGFIVDGNGYRVVDHGTQFGLNTFDKGGCEIHVFKGEVALSIPDNGDESFELSGGMAKKVTPEGEIENIDVNPSLFDNMMAQAKHSQDLHWLNYRAKMLSSKNLIRYFTLEELHQKSSTVVDYSNHHVKGQIVGCSIVPGRVRGKTAILFNEGADAIHVDIQKLTGQFTLAAWIKPEIADEASLITSDGYGENLNGFRWTIRPSGALALTVINSKVVSESTRYYTAKGITPDDFGKWIHVALVYDVANRKVSHYKNGQLLESFDMIGNKQLMLGKATIGNWNSPSDFPAKGNGDFSFKGTLDEFLMIGRAYSENEIATLYQISVSKTQ